MSKYFRKLVLKKFHKHCNISTGFCAIKYWTNKTEENLFGLIRSIDNIQTIYHFDSDENYKRLIKKFHHMSLLSVGLHFLRCRRSCEKKSGYCKMCSRVRENTFYDYNAFLSLKVSHMDDYLNINSSERIDLDVFLNRPAYFPYCLPESVGRCSDNQVFSFAQDLFVTFFSVLVRMHLNITTEYFSDLMSELSLVNEKKVVKKIFTGASLLLYKFFDLSYDFFYEFFYLFSQVNGTDCFINWSNKPKYGPYCGPKCKIDVIMF